MLQSIKDDYLQINKLTFGMALFFKLGILGSSAKRLSHIPLPTNAKIGIFLGLTYYIPLMAMQKALLVPRMSTYLSLLQFGETYEIDKETKELIQMIKENKGEPL